MIKFTNHLICCIITSALSIALQIGLISGALPQVYDVIPPCAPEKLLTPEILHDFDAIFVGEIQEEEAVYVSEADAFTYGSRPTNIKLLAKVQLVHVDKWIYPANAMGDTTRVVVFDYCHAPEACDAALGQHYLRPASAPDENPNTTGNAVFFTNLYIKADIPMDITIARRFNKAAVKPQYETSYCAVTSSSMSWISTIEKSLGP